MSSTNPKLVTVIVPCYNEEEMIALTHKTLSEVLSPLPYKWEFIFVDDGSKDKTVPELEKIQATDPCTKIVIFSRNFGHQFAVSAGIEASNGDAVVLIDADLQDPPSVIKEMLIKWEEGYDVVYGVRKHREGETFFKKITAKMFYRIINKLSDIPIPMDTGDFRLMDRKVVNSLIQMPERDRFIRGMVSWVGYNQTPVYYDREKRTAGVSKYPLFKMLKFAVDGILSFSREPLKLAIYFGFFTSILSILGILYGLYVRIFTNNWVTGWTFLFIAILFFGGIQLICIGIIGEYVGRIYGESKRRPLYIVKQTKGF